MIYNVLFCYAAKGPSFIYPISCDRMRKSKGILKKYLETNGNENTTIQNLWDAAKAVLRRMFIAIQAFLKKKKKKKKNLKSTT